MRTLCQVYNLGILGDTDSKSSVGLMFFRAFRPLPEIKIPRTPRPSPPCRGMVAPPAGSGGTYFLP
jgi:hypothetical protein